MTSIDVTWAGHVVHVHTLHHGDEVHPDGYASVTFDTEEDIFVVPVDQLLP